MSDWVPPGPDSVDARARLDGWRLVASGIPDDAVVALAKHLYNASYGPRAEVVGDALYERRWLRAGSVVREAWLGLARRDLAWAATLLDGSCVRPKPREIAVNSVFVLVLWGGNPEDLPPEIVAVAGSLGAAQALAAEHATKSERFAPPAGWRRIEDDTWVARVGHVELWRGDLTPAGDDSDFYAEHRWYEIHEMQLQWP